MGSKSKSTTSNTPTDARIVADAGAMAISGSNNTLNIHDEKLVDAAFKFLEKAEEAQTKRMDQLIDVVGKIDPQEAQQSLTILAATAVLMIFIVKKV